MKTFFKALLLSGIFSVILTSGVTAQLIEKPEIDDLQLPTVTPMTQKDITPWLYLGIYGAYNLNLFTADFQTLPGYMTCSPGYKEGAGKGYSGGILGEYALNDMFGVEARLGYTMLDGDLTRRGLIGNIKDVQNPDGVVEVQTDNILQANLPAFVFEPMLTFRLIPRLSTRLGASFALMSKGTFEYREEVAVPENIVFLNGDATRNGQSGDIPEQTSLLTGLTVGAGYDFPVARNIFITPEARYTLYFNNISSVNWKVSSVQLGAAIKYAFMPAPEVQVIRDTVYLRDTTVVATIGIPTERTTLQSATDRTDETFADNYMLVRTTITEKYLREVPKLADFYAEIKATGISPDGSRQPQPTIVVEETEWEELFPLLPHVFFDEGESDLNDSRLHVLKESETAGFSEQNLPLATLGVYSELLNIIGSRMKANPSAKITLTGTNNTLGAEKNANLSKARAEAVKNYLTSAWGINANRINIEVRNLPLAPSNNATADGQAENRRVEIKSANYEIIKPVRKEEIVRTATPPLIELEQRAGSEAGLKTWEVRVEQGGQVLRTFKNDIPAVPEVLRWRIDEEPVPRLEEPIRVSLSVTDGTGEAKTAETLLKVQQLTIKKKRFELQNDKRVERYSLILFDFDKAELGAENTLIAEEIKRRIEPNSTITIAGYADRQGENEYNRQLAMRRAQATQKALGLPDGRVVLKGIGSDVLLFDNDIPEGRSYSRTVQVIVETPVTE
jgi:outer membrane protein OmpA-like peptidoglycan-associated protein